MTIDDGTWSLVRQMREQLSRIHDAQTRAMAGAWASAWDGVQGDLSEAILQLQMEAGEGKITRSAILKSQRLLNALDQIEGRLNSLFDQSGLTAIGELRTIVDSAGHMQARLISSQLPSSEQHIVNGWSKVNREQVDAIVRRSTEQITKLSYPLADQATATMKRELVRGLIGGSNPREVARLMVARAEGIFNGGLSRALTIARTEQLDAHRAGAMLAEKSNSDIVTGWIWAATLGSRTCPACWAMNGQEFGPEEFGPDGHQNCRCVRLPQTKSWRDLGIRLDEPPSLRQDSEKLFNALSSSDQLGILGPARFNAWRAGNFPIEEWAQKRTTPGWRDSFVPAKAPTGGVGRNKIPRSSKPSVVGGGSGGNRIDPKPTGSSSEPPIGTVLQAKGGNGYVLPGENRRPRPRGHNPDWEFEYIPDPTHRMTAMLQYYFESEKIVKHVARNILDGIDPLDGLTNLAAYRTRKTLLKAGYTADDLKADALAAGTRLAKAKDVALGTVYRGIALDADAATLLQRYQAGHIEPWSLSSATVDPSYAEAHALNQPGRTTVVWIVKNARGQILQPVGRMASIDERLVTGRVEVLGSSLRADGVVEVYAKWLPTQ